MQVININAMIIIYIITVGRSWICNVGKSTVLNKLADAGVFTADMLFATLDPTTRMVLVTSAVIYVGRVITSPYSFCGSALS